MDGILREKAKGKVFSGKIFGRKPLTVIGVGLFTRNRSTFSDDNQKSGCNTNLGKRGLGRIRKGTTLTKTAAKNASFIRPRQDCSKIQKIKPICKPQNWKKSFYVPPNESQIKKQVTWLERIELLCKQRGSYNTEHNKYNKGSSLNYNIHHNKEAGKLKLPLLVKPEPNNNACVLKFSSVAQKTATKVSQNEIWSESSSTLEELEFLKGLETPTYSSEATTTENQYLLTEQTQNNWYVNMSALNVDENNLSQLSSNLCSDVYNDYRERKEKGKTTSESDSCHVSETSFVSGARPQEFPDVAIVLPTTSDNSPRKEDLDLNVPSSKVAQTTDVVDDENKVVEKRSTSSRTRTKGKMTKIRPLSRVKPRSGTVRPIPNPQRKSDDEEALKRLFSTSLRNQIIGIMEDEYKDKYRAQSRTRPDQHIFRGEINRLEKTRDDLLRRNAFLQKEVKREKDCQDRVVIDKKLAQVTSRNVQLTEEQIECNKKEEDMKIKLTALDEAQQRGIINLAEMKNKRLGLENRLEHLASEKERLQTRENKLQLDKDKLDDENQRLKDELKFASEKAKTEKIKRNDKENQLQIGFDKIDELKNRVIEIRLTLKKHNNETMNAQGKIKRVKNQLQKETEYLKKLNDEEATLKEQSRIVQEEEEKAKKQAQETESKLQDAQNEFKTREELKLSMINSTVQTTGRLVIMRDVAWIKIAEEEVILSPLCSNPEKGVSSQYGPSPSKLPAGSINPVFEVYNVENQSDNNSMTTCSSRKRRIRHNVSNKRLTEAYAGTEYSWTDE
ncbi:unnamed protein product [Clavelina lepadiformis]|uniref:Uncharacterized protein n=1 Tax=Clavelina lepadiformis TaxID=159417 RepID=A0ABP0H319_CLALP